MSDFTDDELAQLVARYRDDDFSEDEIADLLKRFASDQVFHQAFTQAVADATSLDVFFANDQLDHHLACISDAVSFQRHSKRLREVRRITETTQRSAMKGGKLVRFSRILIAAGLLMLASLAALVWNQFTQAAHPWSLDRVHRLDGAGNLDGLLLKEGQGNHSHGRMVVDGEAELSLLDGTRIMIPHSCDMTVSKAGPLTVDRGYVELHVADQGERTFTVVTPHGKIAVLGTQFALKVNHEESIILLSEGVIKTYSGGVAKRWSEPQILRMSSGAVAERVNYIDIIAGDGDITDPDWSLVSDEQALNGQAWVLAPQPPVIWNDPQAAQAMIEEGKGIEIIVPALAGLRYRCWIRTKCDADVPGKKRLRHDSILIDYLSADSVILPGGVGTNVLYQDRTLTANLSLFSGSGYVEDYVWIGCLSVGNYIRKDEAVEVVFKRSGFQRLRIITAGGPLRIDRIRLVPEGVPDLLPDL